MSFSFELFQPGFPAKVVLELPFDKPYTTTAQGRSFLGRTLAAEVARKLGVHPKRVHLLNERASYFMAYDRTFCSGQRMCAYVASDETTSLPALTEISLEGVRHLSTPDKASPALARKLLENVMDLNRRDANFVYSIHRHITSALPVNSDPSIGWRDDKPVAPVCRDYDALMDKLHRQFHTSACAARSRMVTREEADAHAAVSDETLSLLTVMQMLPPPATLCCWLDLQDILCLGLTNRSWWTWVMVNELPELLRQRRSLVSLPFHYSWRTRETEDDGYSCTQTGKTRVNAQLTRQTSALDDSPAAPSPRWPSSADFITPMKCPPTLEWMLDEPTSSRMEAATPSEVAPFIEKWYREGFLADPNLNTEREPPRLKIREFLLAALSLATAIGLYTNHTESVTPKYPSYSDPSHTRTVLDQVAVCLLIPTSAQDSETGAANGELEIFWSAEWGTETYVPF